MMNQIEALQEASIILEKSKIALSLDAMPIWQLASHAQKHIDAQLAQIIKSEY